MKINNWPQAIVAVAGIAAVAGIVVSLALAGWSAEAIVGFAGLAAALVAGQFIQTRRAAVVEAKTDQQTETLQVIERQTNGHTSAQLQEVADRTAEATVRRLANGGR